MSSAQFSSLSILPVRPFSAGDLRAINDSQDDPTSTLFQGNDESTKGHPWSKCHVMFNSQSSLLDLIDPDAPRDAYSQPTSRVSIKLTPDLTSAFADTYLIHPERGGFFIGEFSAIALNCPKLTVQTASAEGGKKTAIEEKEEAEEAVACLTRISSLNNLVRAAWYAQ